jgi:succinate dehydrogenase/fumarate reductase-like Fe-S protein
VVAAEAKTILAALDEVADHKRDRAATCADCADQSCGSCQFRLTAASDYDRAAARLLAAHDHTKSTEPAESIQRAAPADMPGASSEAHLLADLEAER